MLELVTLPAAFGMRNVSPFCLKIEMLLNSLELEFTLSDISNPAKAPKGKLPFLVADGQRIGDSELIAQYLDGLTGGKVFAGLTDRQIGQGYALTRLVEDHLYWLLIAGRWLDENWWPNVARDFFGSLPPILRQVVAGTARRRIAQTYKLHGLGRHKLEEQQGFARRDLESLAGVVPARGFLFGDQAKLFDFTVAAMMAGIYDNKPATWLTDIAMQYEGLHAYTERVQDAVGVWGRK